MYVYFVFVQPFRRTFSYFEKKTLIGRYEKRPRAAALGVRHERRVSKYGVDYLDVRSRTRQTPKTAPVNDRRFQTDVIWFVNRTGRRVVRPTGTRNSSLWAENVRVVRRARACFLHCRYWFRPRVFAVPFPYVASVPVETNVTSSSEVPYAQRTAGVSRYRPGARSISGGETHHRYEPSDFTVNELYVTRVMPDGFRQPIGFSL